MLRRITSSPISSGDLNSPVVSSLIVSIFTPLTPLHDGAVIVNGDQIVAARCTLPLSQNPYYVHTLGTRHRAAVGLTEETDAVVIVVSEETGALTQVWEALAAAGVEVLKSPAEIGDAMARVLK